MALVLLALLALVFVHNVYAGCESYAREASCMSASYDGVKCSWCSSGAVGSSCYAETDAKALPSSIFTCKYQAAYDVNAMICQEYTTSDTCQSGSVPGDKCVWCESTKYDSRSCVPYSYSQLLPSTDYTCSQPGPSTSCDSQTSSSGCLSSSNSNGVKCAWCTSYKYASSCYDENYAHSLPYDLYKCTYQNFLNKNNLRSE
jgi:hypothetical protein